MAGKLVSDPDRLVAAIEASFPIMSQMDHFFGFDTQLFQIAVPERLALDMVTLADQKAVIAARQEAAQTAADKIRTDVEKFVADCAATLREQSAQLAEEMLQSISTLSTSSSR